MTTRTARSGVFAPLPTIDRPMAARLAAEENRRVVEMLRSLEGPDWSRGTDCTRWDVRALAGHLLGAFEAFAALPELVHQMRAASKEPGDGVLIDRQTAVQVRERAQLSIPELLERLEAAAPRSARARAGVPGPLRRLRMRQATPDGGREVWRLGYLIDVVLTRDAWMHRVDLARATGRPLVLTAEHDGRIVADVVADWARRHGDRFSLTLLGPAGGHFGTAEPGEQITVDAVEFCRVLSGRASGPGLLSHPVPF